MARRFVRATTRLHRTSFSGLLLLWASLSGCKKKPPIVDEELPPVSMDPPAPIAEAAASLPSICRPDGAPLPVAGRDALVGTAVVARDALWIGLVRSDGPKRIASVISSPLSLAQASTVDLGPAFESDPAPVPYVHGNQVYVAFFARTAAPGRSKEIAKKLPAPASSSAFPAGLTRELRVVRIDDGGALHVEGSVVQATSESDAFDVAWPESTDPQGAALVAWDEDAPRTPGAKLADRGVVKVQSLAPSSKALVVSPPSSDAEAPLLLARSGGYWLAWLAKKPETIDGGDAGLETVGKASPGGVSEIPGEARVVRWVELVALDAKGAPSSPLRTVSSVTGHATSFELVPSDDPNTVVVFVEDEAEDLSGADRSGGGSIVRYVASTSGVTSSVRVATNVAKGAFEVFTTSAAPTEPWLSWTDANERVHLLRSELERPWRPPSPSNPADSLESALENARPLAFVPPETLVAVSESSTASGSSNESQATSRFRLARLICRP